MSTYLNGNYCLIQLVETYIYILLAMPVRTAHNKSNTCAYEYDAAYENDNDIAAAAGDGGSNSDAAVVTLQTLHNKLHLGFRV